VVEKEHKLIILAVRIVTHNVRRFILEKPKEYVFIPGQATEVSINKPGFNDKKHPFTITSVKRDKILEFTIKIYPVEKHQDHEGVTEELSKLKAGDELIVREAWGTIHYEQPGVFIAGGAGITPFIAIFRDLANNKKLTGNKLIYTNKTRRDIILEQELRAYFKEDDLILTLTQELVEGYETRRVDEQFLREKIFNLNQNFYVCGKRTMVNEVREYLANMGVVKEKIIYEK